MLKGSKNQKICSTKSLTCFEEAKTDMYLNEFNQENKMNDRSSIYNDLNHCNCLPSCTSIAYESEVSQAEYHWKSSLNSISIVNKSFTDGLVKLNYFQLIFLKKNLVLVIICLVYLSITRIINLLDFKDLNFLDQLIFWPIVEDCLDYLWEFRF